MGKIQNVLAMKEKRCTARATTSNYGQTLTLSRGGGPDDHSHPPNREEVEAVRVISGKLSRDMPLNIQMHLPHARIMRRLHDVSSGVLSELPDQTKISTIFFSVNDHEECLEIQEFWMSCMKFQIILEKLIWVNNFLFMINSKTNTIT